MLKKKGQNKPLPADYDLQDLRLAYEHLGIKKGDVVSLKTDLRYLGMYAETRTEKILADHYQVLADLVDLAAGTIVVPTGTPSLCNTSTPFDRANSPSEMGVLTEYVRKQPGSVRSTHPFISYTAIGNDAEKFTSDVSRHAYGPNTPEARLAEYDAIEISVGMPPNETCSLIHHVEMVMGVPYRYNKEFLHPVVKNGETVTEAFYMNVWYRDCDLDRDGNKKIFAKFSEDNEVKEVRLGRGSIYTYSLNAFYQSAVSLFTQDIFVWLKNEPLVKPYRV